MRWILALLITLVPVTLVRADDEARHAQEGAAAANAIHNLMTDIEAERIDANITVGMLLDKTDSEPRFLSFVTQQAGQIGGPRWIDEQTCQVRLELPGAEVARQLVEIARAGGRNNPLPAEQVKADLRGWEGRVFSATGTSTARIDAVRPPASAQAWRDVGEEDVRRAVAAARQAAVTHVLDNIGPAPLAGDKKIGNALAIPEIGNAMTAWLGGRPVTQVEFREDHQVEVTIAVSAGAVSEKLRSILTGRTDIPTPGSDQAWGKMAEEIAGRMGRPVGLGKAAAATQPSPVALFAQPPEWVQRQLDAEGTGPAMPSKLKAARLAEAVAMSSLRDQIRALPVSEGVTLGSAADRDPHLADAVERGLRQGAHVYRVDYQSDGSVSIRISIDLRAVWEQIDESH